MDPVSRRSFLVGSSASVAGAAVTGGGIAVLGGGAQASALSPEELGALDTAVMLHVIDAATGAVELLVEDREVLFTDKALVAKVLRATQ